MLDEIHMNGMDDKTRFCGLSWCVRDACGLTCAVFTWFLILYGEFCVLTVMMTSWSKYAVHQTFHAIIFHILLCLAFSSHIKTMFTDPGAVPKAIDRCSSSVKPERAHHCSVCGRCVRRMDHHCPWVNNCVGEGNQKYFVLFTMYIALLSTHAVYWGIWQFILCVSADWQSCSLFGPPVTAILLVFLLFEAILLQYSRLLCSVLNLIRFAMIKLVLNHSKMSNTIPNNSLGPDGWKNLQMIFGGPFSLRWFNPFAASHISKRYSEVKNSPILQCYDSSRGKEIEYVEIKLTSRDAIQKVLIRFLFEQGKCLSFEAMEIVRVLVVGELGSSREGDYMQCNFENVQSWFIENQKCLDNYVIITLESRLRTMNEVLAIIYICIIIQPEYNEHTKISENALLPALVTERFSYSQRISTFLQELRVERDVSDYIKTQLLAHGIMTQTLRFTVTLPGFNQSGINVVGVVRASRSSSTEAMLVAVSMTRKNFEALAVVLALATYCREQIYWARDIQFVFVNKGLIGLTAYLAQYHEHHHSFLQSDKLHFHSGAIVGAFAVKAKGLLFDTMNIEHNMVNGLLPNLDLINLMAKLADKFSLMPEVFNHGYQGSWWNLAETASKAMLNQAFNEKEGLHSIFGPYGIQAVTIHAKSVIEGHSSLTDLARICEGALRSLNNILEKFHQSYFLYVMTDIRHFLSVAYYMPALGLILFPLLILALREWFSLKEFSFPNSFVLLHVIGIVQYCIIRSVAVSQFYYTYTILLSFSGFIPWYFLFPLSEKECISLKFIFYLDYCLMFASLSLLNFSLAYIISLIAVPLIIIFTATDIYSRFICRLKAMFGFLIHPFVIYLLCRYLFYDATSMEAHIKYLAKDLIKSHLLYGSFLFPFIYICLLPLWNFSVLISSTPVNRS
ncbi:Palmitoyltransferase ZDHHC3 [Dirofilaria immitis]|nr:Palmitoyltransferase ZDHHC3 [Dirofilaria immitis]